MKGKVQIKTIWASRDTFSYKTEVGSLTYFFANDVNDLKALLCLHFFRLVDFEFFSDDGEMFCFCRRVSHLYSISYLLLLSLLCPNWIRQSFAAWQDTQVPQSKDVIHTFFMTIRMLWRLIYCNRFFKVLQTICFLTIKLFIVDFPCLFLVNNKEIYHRRL